MVIIWGNRPYFRKNQAHQRGFCPHCGRFAAFKSFDARTFFHLYYIPLIPVAARKRFHKMCGNCNMAHEIELEPFQRIIDDLKQNTADAILALQDNEPTFTLASNNETIDAVDYLLSAMDWLYASQNKNFCVSLIQQLAQCRFAQEMMIASLATMDGNVDHAIDHYTAASQADATRYEPFQHRAHLEIERKRVDDAIESYKQALSRTSQGPVQLGLNLQLVDLQMQRKAFADAVQTYDRILVLHPPLGNDKSFMKSVQKAKKKAGVA
jgi:tetratricopeptide (TPR) repeat protein